MLVRFARLIDRVVPGAVDLIDGPPRGVAVAEVRTELDLEASDHHDGRMLWDNSRTNPTAMFDRASPVSRLRDA